MIVRAVWNNSLVRLIGMIKDVMNGNDNAIIKNNSDDITSDPARIVTQVMSPRPRGMPH